MNVGWFLAALGGGLLAINVIMWVAIVAYLRRKYPLPAELAEADPATASEGDYPGYYLETRRLAGEGEAGRFAGWHLLARGNGVLSLTPRGVRFLRRGSKRAIWIPHAALRRVNVALAARARISGQMSLELDWEVAGLRLRSIFVLRGGVSPTVNVAQRLEPRVAN